MKDFNLHKFLRENPLTKEKNTLSKGKINEAFEGFGGVRSIGAIGDGVRKQNTNSSFDPTDTADYDEQSQPNAWIADIDRMPDYNGWKASWEHPGLIVWSNEEVPNATVVATPGWDGKGTPVEFQSGGGVSQMLKVLDQDNFPTFKAYLSAIKPYLDMVLDANVNPTSTDYETSDIKAPGMGEFQGVHEGEDDSMTSDKGWQYDDEEEMPSRIEGLINQRELAKFAEAVMAIAQDLDDDGFDAIDIKKLLKDKLDDMIIG